MLALCSASSAFARPGRQQLATRGASVRMATNPGEVWESYKAVVAASTEYKAMPSVDSALALCRVAATSREADPDTVCEAMLTVEKGMRDTAKADGGELSRSTLQSLDGAWRLVFTTGTVEMQSKLGRKVDYFPLRATQTFDTRTNAITNGIYVGSFALVRFFGSFEWREVCVDTCAPGPPGCTYGLRVPASCVPYVPEAQGSWCTTARTPYAHQPHTAYPSPTAYRVVHRRLEERRRVEFDFDRIAVLGLPAFDLPKGGAEELGAATGLGAKSNVKRAEEGKKVACHVLTTPRTYHASTLTVATLAPVLLTTAAGLL